MATYLHQLYNFEPTFINWLCFEESWLNFCNGYLSLLYFCYYHYYQNNPKTFFSKLGFH